MQAVILAAGLGSRLRPLTNDVPKAMVKYKNKEIICYQLDALYNAGIKDIHIVTGYKSTILKEFLSLKYDGLNFIHNNYYNESNSAYSFNLIKQFIKSKSYIHINCDILFSTELLHQIIISKYENIIAIRSDINLKDSMENAEIDNKGQILEMSLKTNRKSFGKAYGLAKISSIALKENIKTFNNLNDKISINENYFGLIRRNMKNINYYSLLSDKHNLSEINTIEDLNNCEFKY